MTRLCISSLVVQTPPEMLETVRNRLQAIPQAEVIGANPCGKLVVVLDTRGSREAADTITAIRDLAGVLSASLVYQHEDQMESPLEETA